MDSSDPGQGRRSFRRWHNQRPSGIDCNERFARGNELSRVAVEPIEPEFIGDVVLAWTGRAGQPGEFDSPEWVEPLTEGVDVEVVSGRGGRGDEEFEGLTGLRLNTVLQPADVDEVTVSLVRGADTLTVAVTIPDANVPTAQQPDAVALTWLKTDALWDLGQPAVVHFSSRTVGDDLPPEALIDTY